MLDSSSTYVEVERSGVEIAILPVGATEQHGPHLPQNVDFALAAAVANGVGERLGAYVLPAMPFGNSRAHQGFRGSVWVGHDTLAAVVRDLARCLLGQGFRWVAVLNMHGGNVALRMAVRDVNFDGGGGRALLVDPLALAGAELGRIIETLDEEQHAGELETSLILHLFPHLVRGEGPDCVPEVPGGYFDVLPLKLVSPTGVWGRASKASADKGARALAAMIEHTADYLTLACGRLDDLAARSPGLGRGS